MIDRFRRWFSKGNEREDRELESVSSVASEDSALRSKTGNPSFSRHSQKQNGLRRSSEEPELSSYQNRVELGRTELDSDKAELNSEEPELSSYPHRVELGKSYDNRTRDPRRSEATSEARTSSSEMERATNLAAHPPLRPAVASDYAQRPKPAGAGRAEADFREQRAQAEQDILRSFGEF